jgi:diaminopimelate decarboxylase
LTAVAAVAGDVVAWEPRDGEEFLPDGFFDFYPDLAGEHSRFAPLLGRMDTPLFLADTGILEDRFVTLQRLLDARWGPSAVAYSFKTNYAVAESRVFQEQGAWAEVVSGREYRLARRLGYAGEEIVFNGPYKRDDELRNALRDGALIHVNDLPELERLLELLPSEPSGSRIGLRVSAGASGPDASRFGLSLARGEAAAAVERVASVGGLELAGFHLHLRGDTDDPAVFRRAAAELARFVAEVVPAQVRRQLASVDLGGGFPAHGPKPRSRTHWSPRPIAEYVQAIVDGLEGAFPTENRPTLILEPGRYLVADGIVFVSEIVRVERDEGLQLVTADGAVTMLPLTHYCPQIVRAFSSGLEPRGGAREPSIVFGASCRENDVLYRGSLPPTAPGDYLVFYAAGAYNSTLSPAFIFETAPVVFS